MPVVAAVNGFALGGGCELALACDFIYASENARFGLPEVSLGVIPGFGGTQRLARLLGRARAKELIFTGDMIDAARAKEIGLVLDVVPLAERSSPTPARALERIAKKGPLAVRRAKRAIDRGADLELADGLHHRAQGVRRPLRLRGPARGNEGLPREAGPGLHRPLGSTTMDFELTDLQRETQRLVREFAARELIPNARKLGRGAPLPAEAVKKLAELSLLGVAVPEEWGGAGLDNVAYALAIEEISRGCASAGVIMSVNNSLYCDPVLKFGTDAQKREWLVPFARGEKLGCFGLTEPEAGSDAAAQKTTAVRKGDSYVINGSQELDHQRPGGRRDRALHHDRPGGGPPGHHRVPRAHRARRGSTARRPDRKMGIRAALLLLHLLRGHGGPGEEPPRQGGRRVQGRHVHAGRRAASASPPRPSASPARPSRRRSRYAQERKTFGQPIANHQAIQFMLADMATEIDAARLLTLQGRADQGPGRAARSPSRAMAKLYASEMASRVANKGLQIHGGQGYSKEFDAERHVRDARITEIYEGTSEIQRIVISSALLKE